MIQRQLCSISSCSITFNYNDIEFTTILYITEVESFKNRKMYAEYSRQYIKQMRYFDKYGRYSFVSVLGIL